MAFCKEIGGHITHYLGQLEVISKENLAELKSSDQVFVVGGFVESVRDFGGYKVVGFDDGTGSAVAHLDPSYLPEDQIGLITEGSPMLFEGRVDPVLTRSGEVEIHLYPYRVSPPF